MPHEAPYISSFSEIAAGEQRSEVRTPTDAAAEIRMISPFHGSTIPAKIADVSRSGLKVRIGQHLQKGTVIQIRLDRYYVMGEVRYCIPADSPETFLAGVKIEDVHGY